MMFIFLVFYFLEWMKKRDVNEAQEKWNGASFLIHNHILQTYTTPQQL